MVVGRGGESHFEKEHEETLDDCLQDWCLLLPWIDPTHQPLSAAYSNTIPN